MYIHSCSSEDIKLRRMVAMLQAVLKRGGGARVSCWSIQGSRQVIGPLQHHHNIHHHPAAAAAATTVSTVVNTTTTRRSFTSSTVKRNPIKEKITGTLIEARVCKQAEVARNQHTCLVAFAHHHVMYDYAHTYRTVAHL